jgi:hypothetical protein
MISKVPPARKVSSGDRQDQTLPMNLLRSPHEMESLHANRPTIALASAGVNRHTHLDTNAEAHYAFRNFATNCRNSFSRRTAVKFRSPSMRLKSRNPLSSALSKHSRAGFRNPDAAFRQARAK